MATTETFTNAEVRKEQRDAKENILEVKNLKTYYPIKGGFFRRTVGHVKAVDDISFNIKKGETFGLVGESGCGKSTAGRTLLRLLKPTEGEIIFDGENITNLAGNKLRKKRQDFQMVFQDPYASLNPMQNVGEIVAEPIRNYNTGKSKKEIEEEVRNLLTRVGLPQEMLMTNMHMNFQVDNGKGLGLPERLL